MTTRTSGNNITLQSAGPDTYTSGCVLQTRLHFIPASQAVPKLGEADKPACRRPATKYWQKNISAHKSGMVGQWYEIKK